MTRNTQKGGTVAPNRPERRDARKAVEGNRPYRL